VKNRPNPVTESVFQLRREPSRLPRPEKGRFDWFVVGMVLAVSLLCLTCAPGNARWDTETGAKANFWAGLWHGLIIVVTFIVSLFTKDITIYEAHNVGWGYNIGFMLGCMISLGGGVRATSHKRKSDKDWDELGRRIAEGVREGLKTAPTPEPTGPDWDEFGRRIEERVREELRKARFRR
jgi:hypothetical protein